MPALMFFRRKWLVACDDLVIPFAIEAVFRIAWLAGGSVITWLSIYDCEGSLHDKIFLYAVVADLLISACLAIGLSFISSKGSVLEVQKRKFLSLILYFKFIMVLFDCAVASYGTWMLSQDSHYAGKDTFIKVTTIFAWLYVFIVGAGVFVSYNSLGSSKYWKMGTTSNSLNFFKKAEQIWRLRLKFFCCCADISEDNDFIYVEISTFLASFLNGIDLVPTDILAGIIILSGIHAIQKREKNAILQSLVKSDKALENKPLPDWMTAANALYFLRIAKSTYGWLAFFDVFHPWNVCTLVSCRKCCMNCVCSNEENDDCCYCNISAVQKITGFSGSDILFASFRNCIYEPSFYIAVDHQRQSVIIAISGTRSFSDLVTDIDADTETFPLEKSPCKFICHRGVLRSAMLLLKKITEMNTLSMVFSKYPSYKLTLTGHSLGASIASVLGLLLRPVYPELQCFAFSPLAVLSGEGIALTLDFVFTVVIGDDMAPRLCVNSCKELRVQLMKCLEETKVPKYKLLTKAFLYHLKQRLKIKQNRLHTEIYENKEFEAETDEASNVDFVGDVESKDSRLYAPGRILYLRKRDKYEYHWITGISLQNIIISPGMIKDHQPHQIQSMLEIYMQC